MTRDTQVMVLAELLEIPYTYALGIRATLWLLVEKNNPIGLPEGTSPRGLADEMEWSGDPERLTDALVQSGFLERSAGGLSVPDWVEESPHWFGFSSWLRRNGGEL